MNAIVDAHLDLAWNAANGRDLRATVAEVRAAEGRREQQCMVTLPELRRGGIAVVGATVFVLPDLDDLTFKPELERSARAQVDVYRSWEASGEVRIIEDRRALDTHLEGWEQDRKPGLVICIEGAEPIRSPDALPEWFDLGVRMIGPAWGPTRYCGGHTGPVGRPDGFTDAGRDLLAAMADLGIILDLAHGSVAGFWEGLESDVPHVVYTHTTPREHIGVERMPDARMLKALAGRGGVVGIGLGNVFLDRRWWQGSRPDIPLATAADLIGELAGRIGWEHVGIGSDLDGGIGVEESPVELDTIADVRKLLDLLPEGKGSSVLGGNWLRVLRSALPQP